MNILQEADKIISKREGEQASNYGPFIECNERIAKIASLLCNKEITIEDIYKFQIALKLGREAYKHKEDNLLDAAAYIGALNDYYLQKEENQ